MQSKTGGRQVDFIDSVIGKFKDPLHKNAIYLMMNHLVTSGLGFIFWMVVARYYPPHEVGVASVIISSMLLIAILGNLGFGIGLIRFLPDAKTEDANEMINSCFTISGIFTSILIAIFLIGLNIWAPDLGFIRDNAIYVLIFFLFTLIWMISPLINSIFISKRASIYVFIKDSGIFSVLKVVLPLVFITYGAFGIYASWGLAAAMAFIVSILFFLRRIHSGYKLKFIIKKKAVNHMIQFSLGNHIGEVFKILPGLVLPLMILNLLTASDAGYFYISWMLSSLLIMIPIAVSTSLLAEGSIKASSFKEDLRKSVELILALLIPATLIIYFLGDMLLVLVGTQYSDNAFALLQLLAIASLPFTINIIYMTIKRLEKKVKEIIGIYGIMAFGTLGMSYIFINDIGLVGAGYAWLFGQTTVAMVVIGLWLRDNLYSGSK
jgi:O-antigen/teichoic acid export membrane protein